MDEHRGYKTIRLGDVEYTEPRHYFVTLCAHQRQHLFGEVISGEVMLNAIGTIVCEEWLRSAQIRREMVLDEFVIMPDHMHALIGITAERTAVRHYKISMQPSRGSRDVTPRSLSTFIAQFKAYTTKRINGLRRTPGERIWQPRFYEHIVRNSEDFYAIRAYILNNPSRWQDKKNARLPWEQSGK
jgi:putative transposase